MSSTTKSETKKKSPKIVSAIEAIIIGVFEDNGPFARFSNSKLPKKLITRLVIHGMSAVHGGDDMIGGLYGPLPLFEKPIMRYLIFSFKVKATNTKDSRIAEHGRNCSVFLVIKKEQQRFILNNHLSIEKILNEYINEHWNKELDITQDSMLVLFDKINEIIKVQEIRCFSFGNSGLIEFADPQVILDEGVISIFELAKQKINMYLPKEKFDSKTRIKAIAKIEEINLREFGSQLTIVKVRDYVSFKKLLDKYSIQIVK